MAIVFKLDCAIKPAGSNFQRLPCFVVSPAWHGGGYNDTMYIVILIPTGDQPENERQCTLSGIHLTRSSISFYRLRCKHIVRLGVPPLILAGVPQNEARQG